VIPLELQALAFKVVGKLGQEGSGWEAVGGKRWAPPPWGWVGN
jgi:hypothetical protein